MKRAEDECCLLLASEQPSFQIQDPSVFEPIETRPHEPIWIDSENAREEL